MAHVICVWISTSSIRFHRFFPLRRIVRETSSHRKKSTIHISLTFESDACHKWKSTQSLVELSSHKAFSTHTTLFQWILGTANVRLELGATAKHWSITSETIFSRFKMHRRTFGHWHTRSSSIAYRSVHRPRCQIDHTTTNFIRFNLLYLLIRIDQQMIYDTNEKFNWIKHESNLGK